MADGDGNGDGEQAGAEQAKTTGGPPNQAPPKTAPPPAPPSIAAVAQLMAEVVKADARKAVDDLERFLSSEGFDKAYGNLKAGLLAHLQQVRRAL